ncbi:cytochrome P450, partial [Mycena polygramma]
MISQILWPIAGTFLCYLVVHVVQVLYHDLTSPLRHVSGPRSPSYLFGNFNEMAQDAELTKKWREQFGANFTFKGLFSISELHTADIKAITHIVTNGSLYQKVPSNRYSNQRLLGRALCEYHLVFDSGLVMTKSQRRAMASYQLPGHQIIYLIQNPAFGVAQIRVVTEIFVEKAVQLRDIWMSQVTKENGEARIDVLSWLRRMTLDVIGQAGGSIDFYTSTLVTQRSLDFATGFNYQFDALSRKSTELNDAFTELFHSPEANRYARFRISQGIMPILRLMPVPGWTIVLSARNKMRAIGSQILSESKANINSSEGTKTLGARRDLLSILLKANLSKQIPESQRLSDAEVIGQIPTFFFAGHETTSVGTSWALHALSLNTAAQRKLRDELFTISTDNPTMDELNSLPYLESVVRETMRVHAPAVFTQRMAMADDVLPLSKPYVDKAGTLHDSLPLRKGQMIHIPILAVNTDKDIWGEDATEFKPERWEHIPESASAIPSVYANLLTFFAGPHNCIGFRFSLAEMKALLFTLIRAFEFEPAVPGGIGPKLNGLLQRPSVLADEKSGSSLPLILKAYNNPL